MNDWKNRPKDQRSPFESFGRRAVYTESKSNSDLTEKAIERAFKSISEQLKLDPPPFTVDYSAAGPSFSIYAGLGEDVGNDKQSRARSRLREEEQRLRGAVEQYFLTTKHSLAWDDVVGNDAARAALVEAVEDPIRHRDLYAFYGKRPTKGVLLYGPPGCGKTMFGKAAASILATLHPGGADQPVMISIKGPEIQSPYVGVTERTIRSIFAYARAYKALHGRPLVVFIDEADAILPSRDGAGGRRPHSYEESQVAAFLAEMDGLDDSGAFVILATNRPDAIDAAVLRDGRCDRKIRVERPDRAAATAILAKALSGAPLANGGGDVQTLAEAGAELVFAPHQVVAPLETDTGRHALTLGDIVNGAMLVGIVEQAKAHAFRRDLAAGTRTGLGSEDLAAAIRDVVGQNAGLSHIAAIIELGARLGFTAARVITSLPPRYGLDTAGAVVQLQ